MNDRNGPASFAATALAESAQAMGATGANAARSSDAETVPGVHSGVGPAATPSPIGRVIHGRYRVKRLLGEGGMGGVYEGEHLEIGKRVAIKIVHALHARDPQIAARIKQEARSTGAIESEHIVQVFDAGEDDELGLFLVMEMLKGEDLAKLLLRRARVSPMAAATIIVQAAQGLARAHAAGIVHRDLKPANIFISTRDDGSSLVKLVDFGIAKLVRDANQANQGSGAGITRMGMVIGTPQYMSPEQAQGLLTVDHRTDIYSLGAVLFEAIVGASPYREMPTYEQTILQIMTRPAPRISSVVHDVHPDLDQLCADMMAHDANARPRDMSGQARAQVDAVLARSGLSGVGAAVARPPATPASSPTLAKRLLEGEDAIDDVDGVPKKGNGLLIGVMIGFILLGVGGGIFFMKMRAAPAPAGNAGYALVQSTAAVPPATAPTPPPSPVAQAAAIPTAPVVVPEPSAPPAKAPEPSRSHAKPARPAPPVVAAPTAAPTDSAPARPVGGTGVSTEF